MADNTTSDCVSGIVTWLEQVGCCARCVLRYVGERDYKVYANLNDVHRKLIAKREGTLEDVNHLNGNVHQSTENAKEDSGEEQASKRMRKEICISCIGLLQQGCESRELETIVSAIEQSKCEFSSFVIQLSIPVTVELRQHLLLLHLEEQFPTSFTNTIASVKDVWKWVVGSYIGKRFRADFNPYCSFQVSVPVVHQSLEEECSFLLNLCPEAFPAANMKKKTLPEDIITRAAIQRLFQLVPKDKLKEAFPLPLKVPSHPYSYGPVTCSHQPLYIAGRYNKYSRKLSQTPWIVDGEKKMETSVQEIIVDVVQKHIPADKIVFSSSGREDVDVQMLGKGRPFVLEFINPLCIEYAPEKLKLVQDAVNSSSKDVFVRDLQIVRKEDLQCLKEGEEGKKKVYTALCCASRSLTEDDTKKLASMADFVIKQKTPIRVLHRRTLSIRERTIYDMSIELLEERLFHLHVTSQAGTYIKEFVHGDFGRTVPHLGSILNCETDILELDVEEIELDWPPPIDDNDVPCD